MQVRVFIVRHGETEWSLTGRHTGRTDLALTARGEYEARAIEPRLRIISFTRVLTSPRQRARRTCELAGLIPGAEIEPDLAEWDYGDYEGRRSVDILQERPDWNLFRDGCPGGETPVQILARADRLIARLRTAEGNIAVFTHGHLGRVLGVRWIGLPVITAQHFLLGPTSLSVLAYEHDRADQPAIALWNAAAHATSSPDETGAMKRRAIERWENEGGKIPNPGRGP